MEEDRKESKIHIILVLKIFTQKSIAEGDEKVEIP